MNRDPPSSALSEARISAPKDLACGIHTDFNQGSKCNPKIEESELSGTVELATCFRGKVPSRGASVSGCSFRKRPPESSSAETGVDHSGRRPGGSGKSDYFDRHSKSPCLTKSISPSFERRIGCLGI